MVHLLGPEFRPVPAARQREDQLLGLAVSSVGLLEQAIPHALEQGFDLLLLDGSNDLAAPFADLAGPPDLTLLRDAIAILRRIGREESIDLVYFGGLRSGTDAAKAIALGAMAVVYGAAAGLAVGGRIEGRELRFTSDYTDEDRCAGIANILKANAGEASMMARCTGKTDLHNLEPEDLRTVTLAAAEATAIPLAGRR